MATKWKKKYFRPIFFQNGRPVDQFGPKKIEKVEKSQKSSKKSKKVEKSQKCRKSRKSLRKSKKSKKSKKVEKVQNVGPGSGCKSNRKWSKVLFLTRK